MMSDRNHALSLSPHHLLLLDILLIFRGEKKLQAIDGPLLLIFMKLRNGARITFL